MDQYHTDEEVTFLQIETTTRCNYNCIFCCGRDMVQGDIDFDVFRAILKAFPHTAHLELQGEGEPFLHPRFFDMVRLARDRGTHVTTITNGSLFTEERVEEILESGIETIHVSIESPGPETFYTLRGGSLENVIRGIERLIVRRDQEKLDLPAVGFAITVLRDTVEAVPDILKRYKELGMDGGVLAQPLRHERPYLDHYRLQDKRFDAEDMDENGRAAGDHQEPNSRDRRIIPNGSKTARTPKQTGALNGAVRLLEQIPSEEEMAQLESQLASHGDLREIFETRRPALSFYEKLFASYNPSKTGCSWLQKALYVNRKGYLMPCCKIKDDNLYAFGRIGVQNIRGYNSAFAGSAHDPVQLPDAAGGPAEIKRIEDIYEKRRMMNEQLLSGEIPDECVGCGIAENCAG